MKMSPINLETEMRGPTDAQLREGSAALRYALIAWSIPLLYLLVIVVSEYTDNEGRASIITYLVTWGSVIVWFPAGFGSLALALAGISYGFSGRRTKAGRWGLALGCLYYLTLLGFKLLYHDG